MSIAEVRKFVESWIVDAKKDSVAVIDKPIQICGVTLPKEVVGILKAHYFVECEERANQILQMLEDVERVPAKEPTTRTFTKEYLRDVLDLPNGKNALLDEIVEQTRWSLVHEIVFKTPELPDGYGWETAYSVGATESQYERPWDNDDDPIDCTLVRLGTKSVDAWIPAVMPDTEAKS